MKFTIEKKLSGTLARAGTISTAHGDIQTPAFVVVGTKATVKALSAEQIRSLSTQVVLANTYHLYLQPGEKVIEKAGGFGPFMDWHGPTMTDSGGFQAFSLGAAFGLRQSKIGLSARSDSRESDLGTSLSDITNSNAPVLNNISPVTGQLAKVSDEGVMFKSHLNGSKHLFTPERSMEIQWTLGADMVFAFDECTSPSATYEYQQKSLKRTYAWAERCLKRWHELQEESESNLSEKTSEKSRRALFGVIQGGRHKDLREEAARSLGALPFDGFGIGGSFTKEDIGTAVGWVNALLPEDKPRHLLGIGEPLDIIEAVEVGCDLFDCIAPTRMGRHGTLHTNHGRINIRNAKFIEDFTPIETLCTCYTCTHHSRSYLAHLFRGDEMLAATLASIHNLHFILRFVETIRARIIDGTFLEYKKDFIAEYYHK